MCEPGGQLADDSTADEHLLPGAGRPYAIWWALAVFSLSAAAVCSDQPLAAAAAALTLDRKDARRKDERRATRH